jgi:hypothetical protein
VRRARSGSGSAGLLRPTTALRKLAPESVPKLEPLAFLATLVTVAIVLAIGLGISLFFAARLSFRLWRSERRGAALTLALSVGLPLFGLLCFLGPVVMGVASELAAYDP